MVVDPDRVMPNLRVRSGDVPKRLLVVGDPARASRISLLLDNSREISHNREFVLYGGLWKGQEVGVISHGVGSAGAGVCFEELCRSGAQRLIRAGTAGGLQSDIVDGSLIVVSGAVREEGLTRRLVPLSFPALATREVVTSLLTSAKTSGIPVQEGLVVTSDLFYPSGILENDLELWKRAGVKAVEMECSALFIISALHGVESGAIVATDGNPLNNNDADMTLYNPHRREVDNAINAMIQVGLDALILSV